MIRNAAGQATLIGPLERIADGTAVTSGAAISTRIGGATAAGAGTLSHVAGGCWEYAPTQAETDTPSLGLVLSATGARSVPLTIETTRLPVQTAAGAAGGLPVLDGSAALNVNVASIAGDTLAATHLRDDELATPATIPTAADNAAATWGAAERTLTAAGLDAVKGWGTWSARQTLQVIAQVIQGGRSGVPTQGTAGTITFTGPGSFPYGTIAVDTVGQITVSNMTPPA
jgi:hypothetical protein